jgi:hypothetical protein
LQALLAGKNGRGKKKIQEIVKKFAPLQAVLEMFLLSSFFSENQVEIL